MFHKKRSRGNKTQDSLFYKNIMCQLSSSKDFIKVGKVHNYITSY